MKRVPSATVTAAVGLGAWLVGLTVVVATHVYTHHREHKAQRALNRLSVNALKVHSESLERLMDAELQYQRALSERRRALELLEGVDE